MMGGTGGGSPGGTGRGSGGIGDGGGSGGFGKGGIGSVGGCSGHGPAGSGASGPVGDSPLKVFFITLLLFVTMFVTILPLFECSHDLHISRKIQRRNLPPSRALERQALAVGGLCESLNRLAQFHRGELYFVRVAFAQPEPLRLP